MTNKIPNRFKYKFTCDICGDKIISDREDAITCKKCIAEQDEQYKNKDEIRREYI